MTLLELVFDYPRVRRHPVNAGLVRLCLCGHEQKAGYGEILCREWHKCPSRGDNVFIVWERM